MIEHTLVPTLFLRLSKRKQKQKGHLELKSGHFSHSWQQIDRTCSRRQWILQILKCCIISCKFDGILKCVHFNFFKLCGRIGFQKWKKGLHFLLWKVKLKSHCKNYEFERRNILSKPLEELQIFYMENLSGTTYITMEITGPYRGKRSAGN